MAFEIMNSTPVVNLRKLFKKFYLFRWGLDIIMKNTHLRHLLRFGCSELFDIKHCKEISSQKI